MLHTEIKEAYYKTEIIKSVECDICHKIYTKTQGICRINFQIAYFYPDSKFLSTEYLDSKTIHICQDCLTKLKGINDTIDRFINDNYDTLDEE